MSEFWLFGGGVANTVGPVPHTSKCSYNSPLVVVGVERDVAVGVGGFAVDPRAKSGITPGHLDIKEC